MNKFSKFFKILFIIVGLAFLIYGVPSILSSIKAVTENISFYLSEGDSLGMFFIVLIFVPIFQVLVFSLPLVISLFVYFKKDKNPVS